MNTYAEIEFLDIKEDLQYVELINSIVKKCFEEEDLLKTNMYLNIILTNPENIRSLNNKYRNIDKETDVLSFPMFEKEEIDNIIRTSIKQNIDIREVLGDIVISVDRVDKQAKEYGHSFKRELAYMIVHGFYHVMGYDHIQESDKILMREKEENILNKLNITRDIL